MGRIVALLAVSDDDPRGARQKESIKEYVLENGLSVDMFLTVDFSATKEAAIRKIEELQDLVSWGDRILVHHFTCLGRTIGELLGVLDRMARSGVCLEAVDQGPMENLDSELEIA